MAGPYYTTAAIVRKRLKAIDADLLDADIETYIACAESIVESIAGTQDFRASYDPEKWGILRRAATTIAAVMCLCYDTTEYVSTAQAALTADILWAELEFDLNILKDESVITYMKSLISS